MPPEGEKRRNYCPSFRGKKGEYEEVLFGEGNLEKSLQHYGMGGKEERGYFLF